MKYYTTRMASALLVLLATSGVLRAQEAQTQDLRIHLEAAVFDPLEGPGYIAPELRLPAGVPTERWIVQFHRPLTRQW